MISEPIDITVIAGMVGDEEDVINMFLGKFIDSVPENIQQIDDAINSSEFAEAKAKAHKLKSSAKAVGADYLSQLCQRLEDQSIACNKSEMIVLIDDVKREFSRCSDYIMARC